MKSDKRLSNFLYKITSLLLCITLFGTGIGTSSITLKAAETDPQVTKVSDIDTSDGYINLMANEEYPGATTSRYAGRIWADKSVFTDDVVMDTRDTDDETTKANHTFQNDSDFLVSASFLGSTRSITGESMQPIDLMVMLDCSSSMDKGYGENKMPDAIRALNFLFSKFKKTCAPGSRMGLVTYNANVDTVLQLGAYTWDGDLLAEPVEKTDHHWEVGINLDEGGSFTTGSGTYTQGAWIQGLKNLAEAEDKVTLDQFGNQVTRQPVAILVTDGYPTYFNATNWWELSNNATYQGNLRGQPATIVSTLLAGAYWTKEVNKAYKDTDLKSYTIGVIGNEVYDSSYYNALLNPKDFNQEKLDSYRSDPENSEDYTGYEFDYDLIIASNNEATFKNNKIEDNLEYKIDDFFERNTDGHGDWDNDPYFKRNAIRLAYKVWEAYQEGKQFILPVWHSENKTQIGRLPSGLESITEDDFDFIDGYYHQTDFSGLESVFSGILSQVRSEAFYAVAQSTGGQQSAMIYTDPIGEYMEVKEVKGVLWSGTRYDVTEQSDGTYKLTLAAGQVTPKHPITNNEIDIDQLLIRIDKETDEDGHLLETLVIEIPQALLPLRHDEIKVGAPERSEESEENNESGEFQDLSEKDPTENLDNSIQMKSYTSSRYTTKPLRVLYTVGVQDQLKVGNSIDLAKIDENYKVNHITTNGNIQFYSNRYTKLKDLSGLIRDDLLDQDITVGDTTVNFTPNANNRYYFFQKNRKIYKDAACEVPIGIDDMINESSLRAGNYYLKVDYFVSDDVTHGYEGDHVGYTETTVERTADQLKGAVEVLKDGIYTKIGASRAGRLDAFVRQKEKNGTKTAAYSFVPSFAQDGSNEVTVYLGNNGLLEVPNPYCASLSKEVVADNLDHEEQDKEFQFTVKITDKDDSPLAGESYIYVGDSIVDDVESPDNGRLVLNDKGESLLTLKHGQKITVTGLPLGAKITQTEMDYSKDYTTTVNGNGGREITTLTNTDAIPVAEFVNTKKGTTTPTKPEQPTCPSGTTCPPTTNNTTNNITNQIPNQIPNTGTATNTPNGSTNRTPSGINLSDTMGTPSGGSTTSKSNTTTTSGSPTITKAATGSKSVGTGVLTGAGAYVLLFAGSGAGLAAAGYSFNKRRKSGNKKSLNK